MSCSRASGSCPNVTVHVPVHVQYLLPKNGLCHRTWRVQPPARARAIIFSTGSALLLVFVLARARSEQDICFARGRDFIFRGFRAYMKCNVSQLPSKSHYQLRKKWNMAPQQNGNKVTGCPVLLNKWRSIRPRAVALGQKVAKKEVQ